MCPPDDSRSAENDARDEKKERLARQLRANLQRRKAQSRSRRTGEADSRPEGLLPEGPLKDDSTASKTKSG
ncbi:hypothetical protein [Aquamicrobium sp. LC103]|uniref:hypothetical protein n=1 Tax=Aquamicrobium sp. LC103 TaxID=1120658 RepID=UPI000AF6C720|nr:hypothetical protein [Aquamicrobium sp. LC103]TKT74189.1 hypothetical protein XW59_024560 [Aquamicrobium sp. LC103]